MTDSTTQTIRDVCRADELPPGSSRLIEVGGRKIGVFNAGGERYAIEDRCSHDDLSGIKDGYEYGFHDPENYAFKSGKGLDSKIVEEISSYKDESKWMREFRLKALQHFGEHPMPKWAGGMMDSVVFQNIHYFV